MNATFVALRFTEDSCQPFPKYHLLFVFVYSDVTSSPNRLLNRTATVPACANPFANNGFCAMRLFVCCAGTPGDELDHLEGVISKVCNFHVAEKKPVQVPGPDQVGPRVLTGPVSPQRTVTVQLLALQVVRYSAVSVLLRTSWTICAIVSESTSQLIRVVLSRL